MYKLVVLCSAALLLSTGMRAQPAAAQTPQSWTGVLIDMDCRQSSPGSSCPASSATTNFGLMTASGAVYQLDASSAALALQAVQNATGQQPVVVTGNLEGQTIAANSIAVASNAPNGSPGAQGSSTPQGNYGSSGETQQPQAAPNGNASAQGSAGSTAAQPSAQQTGAASNASQSAAVPQLQPGERMWAGVIVDADCREANTASACTPTNTTRHYGLVTADGNFYLLEPGDKALAQTASRQVPRGQNVFVVGQLDRRGQIDARQIGAETEAIAAALTGTPVAGNAASQASAAPQQGEVTISGTLYDAACREQNPGGTCTANPSSTAFGLLAPDGTFYKIDPASNPKVLNALQSATGAAGAAPSSGNAAEGAQGPLQATITGSLTETTLTVDTISLR